MLLKWFLGSYLPDHMTEVLFDYFWLFPRNDESITFGMMSFYLAISF